MRVNLAAQVSFIFVKTCIHETNHIFVSNFQVFSKSVADALQYYGESDTTETERFIRKFDRFFDMMNSRCIDEDVKKRKPDLAPYRKPDDTRLKVRIILTVITLT